MRKTWIAVLVLLLGLVLCERAFPQDAVKRPRHIAVIGFKNLRPNTDTDWMGEGAAETLTTKLAGVPGIAMIERTQIKKVIDEQKFQQLDLVDPKSIVKLGKVLGAERVVIGSYACDGEAVLFNVRVVDVETAEILSTASLAGTKTKIFDALFQLAEVVVQSFNRKVVIVDARPLVKDSAPTERIKLQPEQRNQLQAKAVVKPEAFEALSRGTASEDPDERLRWYSKAVELDPDSAMVYVGRGFAYSRKGDYDRAIRDLDKAIEIDPVCHQVAYYERGMCRFFKRDYERAIQDLGKAIGLDSGYRFAYNGRGWAYFMKGDYGRAIRDFTKGIELAPDPDRSYDMRGFCYIMKSDYGRAIADLDKAVQLDPDDPDVLCGRALAYSFAEKPNQGLWDCDRAIKLKPDCAFAYLIRAKCHYQKGNTDQSGADKQVFLRLQNDVHMDPILDIVIRRKVFGEKP